MEEALYDTGALIDAYRKGENLQGSTTILNIVEFPKALEFRLRVLYPSRADYSLSLEMSVELLEKGRPMPAVDMVIAAMAVNRELKFITMDSHFQRLREVYENFNLEVR